MWAITSEERTKHDKQFDNLKPAGGYITGLCLYFICELYFNLFAIIFVLLNDRFISNEISSFATTWMYLESIMPRELSQSEKDKNHVISLTCEF